MAEPDAALARDPGCAQGLHTTVIQTDTPVEVRVEVQPPGGSGYWFKVFADVIERGAWAALSPAAAKVYICLAFHANGNPALACWPSSETLQRESGLSRSTLYEGLAELVSAGLVVRRAAGGGTTTTTYQIVTPARSKAALGPAGRDRPPRPVTPAKANSPHRALPAPNPPDRPDRPVLRGADPATGCRHPSGIPDGYPSATPDTPVRPAGPHLDPGIKNNSSSGCGSSIPNRSPIGTASVTTPPAAAPAQLAPSAARPSGQAPESQDQGPIGLLIAEGFSRGDAGRLAEFGSDRVRKALANCDSLERRGKLRSGRRSYIARAIQDDYTLSEAAERDLWPSAAKVLHAKLEAVCSEDDAQQLAALYRTPLGAIQARAVSVEDVHAMTPAELLHRLINRGRPR